MPVELLQFHGDEPPEFCRQFGVPYVKAVRVRAGVDLLQYARDYHDAKALLLDAYVEGMHGGTGVAFDWSLIPRGLPLPVILSGGLTAENVSACGAPRAAVGGGCLERRRVREGRQGRREDRGVHQRGAQCGCMTSPMRAAISGRTAGYSSAETLIQALDELKAAYARYRNDPEFQAEFAYELKHYVGRPSPVYHARRWSEHFGGAQVYLKREDLNHTGAHKINNVIGQALLARRMGKPRVIAETGAGMHGVATATIAARYGMECVVYMGSEDIKRQAQNVYRMKLLGATVVPVESGSKTLKDALNEAMRDWVTNVENTFYIIGTVAGPHPYPMMVRDFQSVIGREAREQMPELAGRQPDAVLACVGGGSNAMGIFHPSFRTRRCG